jgi:hypothetical protein
VLRAACEQADAAQTLLQRQAVTKTAAQRVSQATCETRNVGVEGFAQKAVCKLVCNRHTAITKNFIVLFVIVIE